MSDLTRFREHCLRMSTAKHKLDCKSIDPYRPYMKPNPAICGGCITADDHALFRQLASEVEDYLQREDDEPAGPDDDDVPLFGEATG